MRSRKQLSKIAAAQVPIADFIPFGPQVAPDVIKLRHSGDYLAIWRLEGISFEASDIETIAAHKEGLNQLIRTLGGGRFSLWSHKVRRRVTERLDAQFDNAFAQRFSNLYEANLHALDPATGEPSHKQMVTELYISVLYRPTPSRIVRLFEKAKTRTPGEFRRREDEHLAALSEAADVVQASLKRYGAHRLGSYVNNGHTCSEMGSFLGFLVNGQWEEVQLRHARLAEYLPTSRLNFGDTNGMLEIWHPAAHKFAGFLDFQDYPKFSEPGMNNAILYGDYEYIETQSFSILNKHEAMAALKRQQGQLTSAEDASETEINEIADAMDDLSSGLIEMGEYHYSLAVFGSSLAQVAKSMAEAKSALQDGPGFKMAVIDAVPDCAWFAQLPGNWNMRPREAWITSRNFASLSPFHNFACGKRSGNPWGQALALLQTPSGQPFYFNHHCSQEDHDSSDEKRPGNTVVIGQIGVGKTTLVVGLLLFALKYSGLRGVFFDKDRGAEIAIRRLRGRYTALKRGDPTGFNPWQLPLTERNIAFCEQLVRLLAGPAADERRAAEDAEVSHAVRTVMSEAVPSSLRRLSAVWQNLKIHQTGNSVRDRIAKWVGNAPLGWAFDNPQNEHHFADSSVQIYGFDYTEFLDDAELRTPIMAYLLHMTEGLIDGAPFIYWMEEFWKILCDDYFAEFARNKQKTIRKQSGLGVFITQSPSDVLLHPFSKTIVEQSVTQIYMPNPSADFDDYVNGFKVTEQEFEIIRNLGEESRLFLVKQGHRSAVARFDLSGMPDMIPLISGSLDNVELLDQIRAEVSEDPDVWEPILLERIAARRAKLT